MSEGRRSQVVLLDERRLDIIIASRLYAGELLDMVASYFILKEKEYFGISYVDESGHHSWLQLEKRVLEHDFPKKSTSQGATLILYFRVKYFVESITQLRDSATIEAFYLQTKSLIAKGDLEIDSEIIFQLAALVIQATYGDYSDEQLFKCHLKRLPVLPASTLKEFPSIAVCESHVLDHYKDLAGQARGAAIVNYLSIVESLPTYGQHYYEIKDKTGNPCWLSLSYRGISQYDKNDRRTPRRIFLWKQLENLYFRDRKFTVEVHEARRVVHTLSSFNLYEDAIEEPVEEFDDLSNAICDPTTQVSVSRRALAPASVTVYVWYAASPHIAKCIWSMAIAQHQFFLDRNHRKSSGRMVRSLSQIASELSRSVQSLSSVSSQSNISRSNSSTSLPTIIVEGEISEESKAATAEMLSALQSRKDALQDALQKKTEELKALCLKEGELTGELPPETPFQPGEPQPQVRRRVGTSFTISDKVFYKAKGKDRESLNDLELDYEIQSKIASAALKLANDHTARKSVRKLRKVSYQQATTKLRDIGEKLSTLKREKETQKRTQKVEGLPASSSETSISSRSNLNSALSNSSVPPSTSLPQLSEPISSSAPPSPAKYRHRHQSLQHVPIVITDDVYEDVLPYNVHTRRNSSSYSATSEYDAISCGSSSIASLGIPYRNRFEANLDIDGTNHYSVPNRRASQVFNDPDDLTLDAKSQDSVSRYCADINLPGRYLQTPLSCSYDERLYTKSGGYCSPGKDSSYDKLSIDSTALGNLSCGDSTYHLTLPHESRRTEKFNHSFSENALHRSQSASLHYNLSQLHISEPELSLDVVDSVDGIRQAYAVPSVKNPVRPRKNGLVPNPSGHDYLSCPSNQSINQVADLVQASVLLQDCKRATSSTSLEFSVPKTKKKEWLETSLDSPVLTKKRKPKILEACSEPEPSQPAQWLENGLPPVPSVASNFYNYTLPQNSMDDGNFMQTAPTPCDPRRSPMSVCPGSIPDGIPDYRTLNPNGLYPPPSPHAHQPMFNENTQFRHYENIEELSNAPSIPAPQSQPHYENMSSLPDIQNISRDSDIQVIEHQHPHLDFNERTIMNHSVAQPQEPSRHPNRRHGFTLENAREVMVDDDMYEPINFPEKPHRQIIPHRQHCEDLEQSFSYSFPPPPPPISHPHDSHPDETTAQVVSPNWQHFPSNSGADKGPNSPPMAFSPNVEVNVVSVGHFQPYWEETKPYEISDFYKYSTKHRKQHSSGAQSEARLSHPTSLNNSEEFCISPVATGMGSDDCSNVIHQQDHVIPAVPAQYSSESLNSSATCYDNGNEAIQLRHPEDPDKSLSLGEVDLRISLADTFHDEMVAWYQTQESVKKATLV